MRRKKRTPIAPDMPFTGCAMCNGSGWVAYTGYGAMNGGHEVARCPCWLAHQQKIAQQVIRKQANT